MPNDTGTLITTSGIYEITWGNWVSQYSTVATTLNTTWNAWANTTATATVAFNSFVNEAYRPPEPTAMDKFLERRKVLRAEMEWDERAEQKRAGERRARKTLHELVGTKRFRDYEDGLGIEVIGSDGYLYRVFKGTSGNVRMFDPENGEFIAKICFHPHMYDGEGFYLPQADCHISQVLTLLNDADLAHRVANVHSGCLPDDVLARRNHARATYAEETVEDYDDVEDDEYHATIQRMRVAA